MTEREKEKERKKKKRKEEKKRKKERKKKKESVRENGRGKGVTDLPGGPPQKLALVVAYGTREVERAASRNLGFGRQGQQQPELELQQRRRSRAS